MGSQRNVVLYLDTELVRKTRELGFNLSRTFENQLKQLINQLQNFNQLNNGENSVIIGSPGEIRTPVCGSKARYSRETCSPGQSLLVHYTRRSFLLHRAKQFPGYTNSLKAFSQY
jgi:hypothetical protein